MSDLQVPQKKFRPEIEGVRVIAALLVAIYHIWTDRVSGGVDVFFIVSGFLITTSLLSKMEKLGSIHYVEYVLGLVRRLVPLAFTVLLFVTIVSVAIMPKVQWEQILSEVTAAGFYFENWQLALNSIDYLAQNNEASPVQHFWALSIQGQFYIFWPFIIMLAFFIAKKLFRLPVRKTLLMLLAIIFLCSISYSIYRTEVNQPWAYFDTFARVWEFSLGGMLALLLPYLKVHYVLSAFLSWIGLVIILLTGIVLPVSTVFPGYAALLPASGVILIIVAADSGSRFGAEKVLGSKPFQFLGSISYGFYLWHWPLLVFYYAYFHTDSVSNLGGITVILLTVVISFLSSRFLETPIRKISVAKSKPKLIKIALSFILPVVIANVLWGIKLSEYKGMEKEGYAVENYPGAQVIYDQITPTPNVEPIPSMLNIKEDLPLFYSEPGCVTELGDVLAKCSYGETENPTHVVALVGGSHSGHWYPTIMEFAKELKIQLDVYNHDGCRFTNDDFNGQMTEACMDWNELLINALIENPPDLVITTANVNDGDTIPIGYLNQWTRLEGLTEILAIRDNPRMAEDIPLCLEHEKDDQNCAVSRSDVLSEIPPWDNTEGIPTNVSFADLSDYFCDENICPPIIGNVIVYRDSNHLTVAYAKTLAPILRKYVMNALEKG